MRSPVARLRGLFPRPKPLASLLPLSALHEPVYLRPAGGNPPPGLLGPYLGPKAQLPPWGASHRWTILPGNAQETWAGELVGQPEG